MTHKATTIVFVHGIGDQKSPNHVRKTVQDGLDLDRLGERLRLGYWSHILHPAAAGGGENEIQALAFQMQAIDAELEALPGEAREFAGQLLATVAPAESGDAPEHYQGQIFPEFMRGAVTRFFTKLFVRDVAYYFYEPQLQTEIRRMAREALTACCGRRFIVAAHSLGSVIVHDVMHQLQAEGVELNCDTLVTMGSPLGIAEVQDRLVGGKTMPYGLKHWINIAARGDVVALDRTLAGEYVHDAGVQQIDDFTVRNPTKRFPFGPHDLKGYLQTEAARDAIFAHLVDDFANPHRDFVIARDLAEAFSQPDTRIPILIEINDQYGPSLDTLKKHVREAFDEEEIEHEAARLEFHRHFISAELTELEYERVTQRFPDKAIHRTWRNLEKFALLHESKSAIHANSARTSYAAEGDRVTWAVLDTGVNANHPHFSRGSGSVIERNLDCTQYGAIRALDPDFADPKGHGTHVAGVITGCSQLSDDEAPKPGEPSGVAPRTRIWSFKVLDDTGAGRDSYILKALDEIFVTNERSSNLLIHGINLSLGGNFDYQSFGCGDSPLCRELRRLWRQGVVICIAAGNAGKIHVLDGRGTVQFYNNESSIGDPGNLEEAIVVGSVHKQKPHAYGISYFSSRGPTADGRTKPDLVAPGENIVSCRAGFDPNEAATLANYYVSMSGTSMACPHVSGLIAAFLSVKREFIGRPDKVKDLLLRSCTDLDRDPNYQGRGLPHLMRMLLSA